MIRRLTWARRLPSDRVTGIMHLLKSNHAAQIQGGSDAEHDIADAVALSGTACRLTADPIAGISAPRQIILTLQRMEADIANPMRIGDLAAAAGLSRGRFSRAFLRSVGELPRRYLRRRRIEFAQELMLTTRKSLAEIALECGLCDQSHLTKTFHRMVGVSPSAWRRARRGGLG